MPHFKIDLGQLSRIRDFVTETAISLGVDAGALDDLRLAVDEVVTNIIVHGYRGAGEVSLDLKASGDDLVICISDSAPAFDPTELGGTETQTLGERTEPGGLGVYLVNQAMDEIRYERSEGRNLHVMTKRNVIAA